MPFSDCFQGKYVFAWLFIIFTLAMCQLIPSNAPPHSQPFKADILPAFSTKSETPPGRYAQIYYTYYTNSFPRIPITGVVTVHLELQYRHSPYNILKSDTVSPTVYPW